MALRQQVRSSLNRFPEDFVFRLTTEEAVSRAYQAGNPTTI